MLTYPWIVARLAHKHVCNCYSLFEKSLHCIFLSMDNDRLLKDKMDWILEEVSKYEVEIEPDPTLPHLGTKYLQKVLSKCRNYQNRVQYYLQLVQRHEKSLKIEVQHKEMDLDFKMKDKLADDSIVRKQPNIKDREALAHTLLKEEVAVLGNLKAELMDAESSVKLIKMKYDQLRATSADIKMQRNLVRDDLLSRSEGEGYTPPGVNKDKTIEGGLVPAVSHHDIDPVDLLDPEKRPEELPEPIDEIHARQLAEFFNKHGRHAAKKSAEESAEANPLPPQETPKEVSKPPSEPDEPMVKNIDYSSLLED